jgi:hypothetical protein
MASSIVWFLSAIGATWVSLKVGAIILLVGGTFIYPLTQLVLRMMGRPTSPAEGTSDKCAGDAGGVRSAVDDARGVRGDDVSA